VYVVVFEENGSDHGLQRAVGHAAYSNVFMRHGDIGLVHGFADAIEAWQGMDAEQAFPQGQIFFSPNASWLQPPGHAIRMVTDSFASLYLNTTLNNTDGGIDVVAMTNASAGTPIDSIVLRIVNFNQQGPPTPVVLDFGSGGWTVKQEATAMLLSDESSPFSPDPTLQNTLANPTAVLPREIYVYPGEAIMVPAMSFMTVLLSAA
jgi:hypothetical protein